MLAPNLFQVRIILETARTTQAINADARCFSADDSVDGSGSGAELAPDDLGCSGTRISSTTSTTRGVCVVVLVTIGGLVVVSTVAGAVDDASVRALVAVSVAAKKRSFFFDKKDQNTYSLSKIKITSKTKYYKLPAVSY